MFVLGSCTDEVEVGANNPLTVAPGGAAGSAADSGTSAAGGSAGSPTCMQTSCQNQKYQCGDCIDNDADGVVDAFDTDCLGPCDNTEDSFYGGIPGQNNTPCRQDCYFDQDTGGGNDDCAWSHRCDARSLAPDYPPSGDTRCGYDPTAPISGTQASCSELAGAQSARCTEICGPLTPNGCDCFGCCELPAGSGRYVWLGSTDGGLGSCDAAHLEDPSKCRRCTPVAGCLNRCDPCELCVGRPVESPDCGSDAGTGGTGSGRCAPGVRPCGMAGDVGCSGGQYCITGCCVTLIF